ncbi:MAG: pyrroline-5-carboxylate reductase [Patescibacteria group bacterium]
MRLKNLKLKIGIIGAGVMGQIFIDRLLKSKTVNKNQILINRRSDDKKLLVNQSQILILAVKPQDFTNLADEIREFTQAKKPLLVLSIMAGIDVKRIRKLLGVSAVVRAMPNLPSKIGQGITVWKRSSQVSQKQKDQARKILQSLGIEIEVSQEKMIDLATAISGSGPAYVFLFQELMTEAAHNLGLSKALSRQLVIETIRGAVNLQRELKLDPKILREQVTSKAGTTAAALQVFEKRQLSEIFKDALQAAFMRSLEFKKDHDQTGFNQKIGAN